MPMHFSLSDSGVRSETYQTSLHPKDYLARDGVKVDVNSMPGGSINPLPEYHYAGKIAVHEIGHWLGLYHPFEDALDGKDPCDGKGDNIDDTPPQKYPSKNCDVPLSSHNSCPQSDGFDNVNNHMDYSPDYW
ncbi:MAG: hypothetical protein Q9191_006742 [Dirinaria sp. TL-2023a]